MTDGSQFAPKYVENELNFLPKIPKSVVCGNNRNECTAFINIDLTAVGCPEVGKSASSWRAPWRRATHSAPYPIDLKYIDLAIDLSDRVVVMDDGKKIDDGTPEDVRNNQEVIDAYLGVAHD